MTVYIKETRILRRCARSELNVPRRVTPLQPDIDPEALTPTAAAPTAMMPVAAADMPPAPPATATTVAPAPIPVSVTAMVTMVRHQFHFSRILAIEDRVFRLVELVQNSVTGGNTGNGLAGSGKACKCRRPRNAKHSSQKQSTFHQNLPSC
ncbi:hypothetical protein [Mesorhizobium sp. B2-7-1]|uniref:hypothetical protein n=1 Tax=Mesorhizobium sp. B2-7-1 TaxID=2589909 RepID=UPI0015E28327|nr:hypothetical protein [Mesorhizobium sp. B2-7-1]